MGGGEEVSLTVGVVVWYTTQSILHVRPQGGRPPGASATCETTVFAICIALCILCVLCGLLGFVLLSLWHSVIRHFFDGF